MIRRFALTSAILITAASATPALAGSASENVTVSSTVVPNCIISTAPLSFGNYDPISANATTPLDTTGSVNVTCTASASATITLGQGANPDGDSTNAAPLRQAAKDLDRIDYALYQDGSRSTVWGNTAGTGVGHTGTGTQSTITIYGRVPAGQNVPAGAYSDTVTATVTF